METTMVNSNGENLKNDKKPTTTSVLNFEQVMRLDGIMQQVVPIHGRGNFPTLELKLKDLVDMVKTNLANDDILVKDIRINGGAASYVLAAENSTPYKDVDLIFRVNLENNHSFDKIKTAVLESLLNFLPEGVSKTRISSCSLKEAYVHKMVKVRTSEGDRWSLISLNNNQGRNVELKFVDVMRRQFEFSVDSFQINLDSLQLFYGCSEMPMNEKFYPTIVAESVYGDFEKALEHLHSKIIATRNPEEIRGGGLFKYCNLLARNFVPANPDKIKMLEKYMCSRFFIDFNDVNQQQIKLENYLLNHFSGEDHLMLKYLNILYDVVAESTVCLMGHERRQTLSLIQNLACQIYYQDQQNSGHCAYPNNGYSYGYRSRKISKQNHYPQVVFSGNVYGSIQPTFSVGYPSNWNSRPIESA